MPQLARVKPHSIGYIACGIIALATLGSCKPRMSEAVFEARMQSAAILSLQHKFGKGATVLLLDKPPLTYARSTSGAYELIGVCAVDASGKHQTAIFHCSFTKDANDNFHEYKTVINVN